MINKAQDLREMSRPMPTLKNVRHEQFAQYLSQGKPAQDAYLASGYKCNQNSAYQAGWHLARKYEVKQRVLELRQRAAVRAEVTTASLIAQAEQVFQAAMAAKQYSAAVSALREKAILAGLRVERKEIGDAGAFANLSEAELDELILVEYARLKALPAPDSDKTDAPSAKPN